jgi:hypothetical protein
LQVSAAKTDLTNAGFVPAYKGTDGKSISNPVSTWYVTPNGESPAGGTSANDGATVTLTISATNTGR